MKSNISPSEVKSDNQLIAEFMGVQYRDEPVMKVWLEEHDSILFYCEWHPEYGRGTNVLAWDFAPHRNWCQIMPVVAKIRKLLQDNSLYDKAKDLWDFISVALSTVEIKAVNIAVVQFIKFYNSQNQ